MNKFAALAMSGIAGLLITWVLGYAVIPWLHKLKFGQTILDIGPNWHKQKQGTPTMGGIMFIAGTVLAVAVTLITDKIMGGNLVTGKSAVPDEMRTKLWAGLIMALCFGLIGFADDYIKVVKKRNLGLTITQKTVAQILVCGGYLGSIFMAQGGKPYMYIPFVGSVELGFFYWIIGFCVMYGAINAVNFTDGIDGLCSSVTVITAISFVVIALFKDSTGISVAAAALAGACIGFYIWNRNPAKVFMGDTGSMFLGGMVVALAYAVDCPLILLPVGIIYVIEAMSDVIQIGYFKLTHGKRIFKMAPIHHHFEMSGWNEKKIVRVFCFVNVIGCVIGVLLYKFGLN